MLALQCVSQNLVYLAAGTMGLIPTSRNSCQIDCTSNDLNPGEGGPRGSRTPELKQLHIGGGGGPSDLAYLIPGGRDPRGLPLTRITYINNWGRDLDNLNPPEGSRGRILGRGPEPPELNNLNDLNIGGRPPDLNYLFPGARDHPRTENFANGFLGKI